MASYEAPPPPDYASAAVAGTQADAQTLPFRLAVSQAAQLGKKYTDPATGRVYDFTGLGYQEQNAAALAAAKDLMQSGTDLSLETERKRLQSELELLPEFNKLNLDQQKAAIDTALNASRDYTANAYQQNLDFMPKFGELQRAENEKAFEQNLALGKRGTYEMAEWQKELLPELNALSIAEQEKGYNRSVDAGAAAQERVLPGLNDLSLRLQGAAVDAANAAGRRNNETAYGVRDALGAKLLSELSAGDDLTDAQRTRDQQNVRRAQAARGNILGDSAAFDEAISSSKLAEEIAQSRKQNALAFINSKDLAPAFSSVGVYNSAPPANFSVQTAVNPVMPNYAAASPINPTVPNMGATTTSGPNLNPANVNVNPLAFLNPNASQNATNYTMQGYQQQTNINSQQVDPWMAGLGLAFQGLGAAGGVAGLMAI